MAPAESQPKKRTRDEPSDPARPPGAHRKWTLDQQAFDKLLARLGPDREDAGKQYEIIRRKLVQFFERRSIGPPEEHTDETINRVARRIDEGEKIENLNGYFYGVARMVFMEALKEQKDERSSLDTVPVSAREPLSEDDDPEPRLRCLDRCLDGLPPESRSLIVEYYQEERRAKIELRMELAERLRIPLNALRIRAHRIRVSLEKCVRQCLDQLDHEMKRRARHSY